MMLCACPVHAAVSEVAGAPLVFRHLMLAPPRDDEVRVRVVATGVCQTDVAVRDVAARAPRPVVLGHEGAGVVEAVGAAVRRVQPGDHVVMSFAACGECSACQRGEPAYCRASLALNFGCRRPDGSTALSDGAAAVGSHFFGQSSFATHALCHERSLVRVPADLPLEMLGPLGCGLQTGAGAVINTLKVAPGARLAVLGTGAVGLAAVMAARLCGATRIVAVDVVPERLALAAELGATHTIDARDVELRAALLQAVPEGLDHVIDTSGHVPGIQAALASLAPRGRLALISSAKGADIPVNALQLMLGGHGVVGVHQGDSVPALFIPQLIEHHRGGRFPFERLLRFYAFAQLNQALDDLAAGRVIKPVIRMPVAGA
jgi:aryl-alcohol dehydrogenase